MSNSCLEGCVGTESAVTSTVFQEGRKGENGGCFFSLLGLLGDRWATVVHDNRWYRKRSCKMLWKQPILEYRRWGF